MAILLTALSAYIAGRVLGGKIKYRKSTVVIYLSIQLCVLFGFKYHIVSDILPTLAVSYYSLMSIGYVVDVYRGKYVAERNIVKLSAVIFFFPTLMQGPICRFDDICAQYKSARYDSEKFAYGLTRICYGLFKKLVVANRLAIIFEKLVVVDNGLAIWVNIFVYAFYLYSNFSAGIDIAIGIGYLFGIKLPENFNNPFLSKSISEYWRRWHMSLGTWLRDYVFYPISFSTPVVKITKWVRKKWGNRMSKKVPIYIATICVWFVTGIWHGVSANFILWGMLNGIIILASLECEPLYKKFNDRFSFTKTKIYGAFSILRTFILMCILRMLDYNTVSGYKKSLVAMIVDVKASDMGSVLETFMEKPDMIVLILGLVLMFIVGMCKEKSDYNKLIYSKGVVYTYTIIAMLVAVTIIFGIYGIGYETKDFIYIKY